ncbi:MAG TPA: terminase, partial [Gemmatimonadaceae bacterium]|nr:terminase [Gemmatimonadaceae bacterium]
MGAPEAYRQALDQFADWRWRLNNLYFITDKDGRKIPFRMNGAQEALFNEMHYMNVILKARQIGFTTFIQLFILDACVFNSNIRAGTIAHTLPDAQSIFRDKVRFPYDNLPDGLKSIIPAIGDSKTELILANNSSMRVGTSLRSGTLNYLHVSEYGKLCAKYPEKAREVRTGALNTIQAGQIIFIESTGEGQEGHYFELTEAARSKERSGTPLTPLDFKFHFFPWWKDPDYAMDPRDVVVPAEYVAYFAKIAKNHGIVLTPAQK